ncbi:hypothetical protein JS73_07760 [Synergistes jonesii]|uniref:Uncharacterized protein n=1 Tax=Synergistes jonesii TaxID=2754 RepID=A0A073J325_9BACT|nr:hypothetical protein EH55_05635 [Synergistes jonesii]OFB62334.1 hypothetical protein JS73_07760 [Synergistes jonesii]OFB63031.1 hypothetical protein JS79_08280 [Synergistes jonesii]OFB67534.1 hypothetical protein JS78_07765 [Synergistes jonesii]OFB69791.1 hypothetical protein JS77_07780 [Synergistes jonesii]
MRCFGTFRILRAESVAGELIFVNYHIILSSRRDREEPATMDFARYIDAIYARAAGEIRFINF